MSDSVREVLKAVNHSYQLATWYTGLMDAFVFEESDPIDYENYFNEVDTIWNRLNEARELGEPNDDILDTWEEVHRKACAIMNQLKPITFTHFR